MASNRKAVRLENIIATVFVTFMFAREGDVFAAASNDHLVSRSEAQSSEPAYRPFVRRRLSLTHFDFGKIACIPDLGPESSISVYRKDGKYFATELVAEERGFWQNWKKRDRLRVSRIDAEIPAPTAQAYKFFIKSLLSEVGPSPQPPRGGPEIERTMGAEIRLYELDFQTRNAVLSGDVPREEPGPKTKSVGLIYQKLIDYCEKPSRRPALAVEIERDVSRIFGRISQHNGRRH